MNGTDMDRRGQLDAGHLVQDRSTERHGSAVLKPNLQQQHISERPELYLLSQGEGVVGFHGDSQDPLVSVDDGVRDGGERRVADLQTHTGDVPHTLSRRDGQVTQTSGNKHFKG